MHLIMDLIWEKVLPPEHVLIITLYQTQLKLYNWCFRNLTMNHATAHLATIQTSIVHNIQGSDSTLIILDLVSTKNLRFMSHEKHSSAVASLSTPLNADQLMAATISMSHKHRL